MEWLAGRHRWVVQHLCPTLFLVERDHIQFHIPGTIHALGTIHVLRNIYILSGVHIFGCVDVGSINICSPIDERAQDRGDAPIVTIAWGRLWGITLHIARVRGCWNAERGHGTGRLRGAVGPQWPR